MRGGNQAFGSVNVVRWAPGFLIVGGDYFARDGHGVQ